MAQISVASSKIPAAALWITNPPPIPPPLRVITARTDNLIDKLEECHFFKLQLYHILLCVRHVTYKLAATINTPDAADMICNDEQKKQIIEIRKTLNGIQRAMDNLKSLEPHVSILQQIQTTISNFFDSLQSQELAGVETAVQSGPLFKALKESDWIDVHYLISESEHQASHTSDTTQLSVPIAEGKEQPFLTARVGSYASKPAHASRSDLGASGESGSCQNSHSAQRPSSSITEKLLPLPDLVAGSLLGSYLSASLRPSHTYTPDSAMTQRLDLLMTSNIPGGGLGYVAIKDIPKGTLLLEEYPLFRLPEGVTDKDVQNCLAGRSPTIQQHVMSLFIGHRYLSFGNYLGRFLTNALPCGTQTIGGIIRNVAGLFPLAARFNHSCAPNVAFQWNSQEEVMRFYAMTDITQAQELCIAYDVSSLLLTRSDRRARLQMQAGFRCGCTCCIAESRESDDRRIALYRVIVEPRRQDSRETRVDFLTRRYSEICAGLTLLQMEGLAHFRETLLFDGYRVCEEAGDRNNAMLWLREAAAAAALLGGHNNLEVARRLQAASDAIQTPNKMPHILNCPLP